MERYAGAEAAVACPDAFQFGEFDAEFEGCAVAVSVVSFQLWGGVSHVEGYWGLSLGIVTRCWRWDEKDQAGVGCGVQLLPN